jgi:hypothetical protein
LNGLDCACYLPFLHNFRSVRFADGARAAHPGIVRRTPAFAGLLQLSIASETRIRRGPQSLALRFSEKVCIIMPGDDDPGLEDTSSLTDADWVEINKLNRARKADGDEGLQKAFEQLLQHDPVRAARILGAFYPQGRGLADQLAEHGLTVEDFREMIQKLARSPTKH